MSLMQATIVGGDDKQSKPPKSGDEPLSRIERIMQLPAEDEELDPAVADFLNDQKPIRWKDNANVYAWGAGYQTDDPYQLGLKLSKKLRALHQAHDYQDALDTAFLDDLKSLEDLDVDRLCSLIETGCFAKWVSEFESNSELLETYHVHQERYLKFLEFEHFSDVVIYSLDESSPFVPMRFLTAGIKINHLDLMGQLKAGESDQVIQVLTKESTQLRKRLAQADTLVPKMVFHFLYDHHISFINAALSQNWLSNEQVKALPTLKPLMVDELSTRLAWETEERAGMRMIQKVLVKENAPSFWADLMYPGLVDRMIKPNELLNELYFEVTVPALKLAKMDAKNHFEATKAFDLEINYDSEVFPMKAMFNIPRDELRAKYVRYSERMFALDMKIQLLKARVNEGSFSKVVQKATQGHQPYLHHFDQSPPFIEEGTICHIGTKETQRKDWCLPIFDE